MNTTAAVELELLLPSLATANATSVPTTFSDGSDNDETLALFDGFDLEVATALDIDALVGESSGDFAADADDFASPLATLHSSRYSSVGECGSASGSSGTVSPASASPASSSQQTRKQKRHEQQCQSESSSHAISVATVPAPLTSKHTATASAAPRGPPPALRLKRPRKHNRIEILKLRDEVEELEARAAKLRQPADGASSEDKQASAQQAVARARTSRVSTAVAAQYTLRHGSSAARAADSNATASLRSVWLDVAVEQYAALQQAQSLNRRLRDAISSRLRVSSSMQELLSKQSAIHDAELLGAIPCAVDALDSSDLHESVETLFRESGLVSRTIECSSDASTASHTSRTKQDAACGPVFEVATNTRIACHVEALGHMLWRRITDNFNASWRPRWPPHQSPHMHVVHERRMQATLTTELGDIHIDGAAVVKKFAVAAQRVVVTVASKWRVHECDLMLRETSWIILSDAAIDTSELEMQSLHTAGAAAVHSRSQPPQPPPPPPPTSLYQTFYRLYGERADASSATGSSPFAAAPDERTRRIQEAATKNMGEHMREHLVRLQRAMLSEMSIAAVRNVPFQVPAIECPY